MEFVCIYARPVNGRLNSHVLLVLKNKPGWQKGRYNLVGGKIEKGETPIEAAIRELKEESGLEPVVDNIIQMGKIVGTWGVVHCIKIPVLYNKPKPGAGETEKVSWMEWGKIRNNKLLIPNLRMIIPLMNQGVIDWVISDEGPTWGSSHTIAATMNIGNINICQN